ncbi:MAG: hypothetical protein ACTSXL_06095, partial [Alphaproteobacteria bacterium]
LLLVVSAKAADDNFLIQNLSINSYITNWLIAGPLPNFKNTNSIRQGFFYDYLSKIGGESNSIISSETVVPGRESITFSNFFSETDFVNLDAIFKMPDNAVAYAFTFLEVENPTSVYLHAGSDDGISVWLDNKNILNKYIERGYSTDEDFSLVNLTKGRHRLLVKIEDSFGAWKFSFRFTDKKTHEKIIAKNIKNFLNINLIYPTAEWEQVSLDFDTIPSVTSINFKIEGQWLDKSGGNTQFFSTLPRVPVLLPETFSALPECSLKVKAVGILDKTPSSSLNLYFSPFDSLITNREAKVNSLLAGLATNTTSIKIASRHQGILKYLLLKLNRIKKIKNPDISAHLILTKLDKIIENLDKGIDYLGTLKGDFTSAYISSADNSPQPFQISIPESYNSKVPTPLVVFLHDYDENFSSFDKKFSTNSAYISVRVHSYGSQTPYFGLANHDVISVINYVLLNYNIDADRVYLVGVGMGGNGVWRLATSFPDKFAAVSALNSSSADISLKNMYNLPSLVVHGELDLIRPVQFSEAAVNSLINNACPVIFHKLKNVGYQLSQAAKSIDPIKWLLGHRRSREPDDIILECNSSSFKSYWLSVLRKIYPHKNAVANARFIGINNLVLSLKNIEHLAIFLPKKNVESSSLMQLMINGTYKELSAPLPDVIYISNISNSYVISQKNPVAQQNRRQYSAGSWQNIFDGKPVLIVKGSSGSELINRKIDKCSKQLQHWSYVGRKSSSANFEIKKDTEITDDDLLKYNLILLGGPNQNSFVNKIKKELVTPLDDNFVTIGNTNLPLSGCGLWLSQYNPKSEKKLIWIWASPEPNFYDADANWISNWNYPAENPPDLLVVNLKNSFEYEKALLFDKNWKIIPEFLNDKNIGNVSIPKIKVSSIMESSDADYVWIPPEKNLPNLAKLNSSEAANIIFKNSEFIVCEIKFKELNEIFKNYPKSIFSISKEKPNPNTVCSIAVMPRDLKSLAEAAKGNLGNAYYIKSNLRETFKKILTEISGNTESQLGMDKSN